MTGGSTGTGLTGNQSGYDSGLTGGSTGAIGSSGMTGGSGLTGSSHTGGSRTGGTGVVGEAEGYVEGSKKHHRGDGHPEDIVHPGPHVTETAKAIDPHYD